MENNIKICICGKEYINGHLGQCKEYRQSLKNIENKYLAENFKDFKCGLLVSSLCSSKMISVIPTTP